ncbi:MAG: SMP-30/gluconolactonase/LRE family protein [Acidobacteria bacterium]|nr:SMP-30/gluconolactonase/LRE family protein [Acidobacteriota bacterium]MCI0568032.1 SMP-30/gluconolactonase/LRE family protein [Acidobacteriota bacterium]
MSGAFGAAWLIASLLMAVTGAGAQVTQDAPEARPEAIVDLVTPEGVRLVKGTWRAREAKIVEVDHRGPGADLKPTGPANRTHDVAPHAGAADFDDSSWEILAPENLQSRLSTGRLCFEWYRIKVTIPEKIGGFDPSGSTAIFEVVLDDYAEIWVDGKLPLALGQTGGALIKGFNAPNRVVLTRDARPGQQFQLAVFGANGPLSDPPGNFIWVRSATIDFFKPSQAPVGREVKLEVTRMDPALDGILPPGTKLEKLADGFLFTEGPVWHPDGHLLFSDPNRNTIYRWSDGAVSVFRTKSGYSGFDVGEYGQPGSNGLTLDAHTRLTINEHGNRRIVRLEKNGQVTVLADRYEGKRLNSPNDLVYRSDGALYFTDPPFGLPKFFEDPRKEITFSGVYCLKDGKLALVSRDLGGPNGLAFSPDEKYLYVDNWDLKKKVVMRFPVRPDGSLAEGSVFFDMTAQGGEDALDGLKVDQAGNLYVSGPGGVWVLSSEGKHLGTFTGPEHPHNFAWGDADGKTLYLAAKTGLYRIRLGIPGIRPPLAPSR